MSASAEPPRAALRVSQVQLLDLERILGILYDDTASYAARLAGLGLTAPEVALLRAEKRRTLVAWGMEQITLRFNWEIARDEPP